MIPTLQSVIEDRPIEVEVYRNLNAKKSGKPEWSIRVNGRDESGTKKRKVIGYLPSLVLEDVTFHCSAKGSQRINRNQSREVVAWLKGTITEASMPAHRMDTLAHDETAREVRYNPKDRADEAFHDGYGETLTEAYRVAFLPDGICLAMN